MKNLEVEFVLKEITRKISTFDKTDDSVNNTLKYFHQNIGTPPLDGDSTDGTHSPKPEKLVSDTSSGFRDLLEESANDVSCKIQTSTPKKKMKSCHSFSFESADSPIRGLDEKEEDAFLNNTIEEAISKYENEDGKFKEASVQTNFECGCRSSGAEWLPLKKSRTEEMKNPDCKNFIGLYKISEVPKIYTEYNRGSSATEREKDSSSWKAAAPRIRVGLSKRAKPQRLHNKFIS